MLQLFRLLGKVTDQLPSKKGQKCCSYDSITVVSYPLSDVAAARSPKAVSLSGEVATGLTAVGRSGPPTTGRQ